MAFGGARPKVGRHKPRSSNAKPSATATLNLSQTASPPTRRLDSYRCDDRLHSLESGNYGGGGAEDTATVSSDNRLMPEQLSFDVNPPLRPRRPRAELLRTNSSESFLPADREAVAASLDSSTCLFSNYCCLPDAKRSSFDEGRLLDLCSGGGGVSADPGLADGEGGAACSVPSITSSNVSMSDLRPDGTLSELDLYEAPEDDCYIYTYKVSRGTGSLPSSFPPSLSTCSKIHLKFFFFSVMFFNLGVGDGRYRFCRS